MSLGICPVHPEQRPVMKHPFVKTVLLALAMTIGCLVLHYSIGTFSY